VDTAGYEIAFLRSHPVHRVSSEMYLPEEMLQDVSIVWQSPETYPSYMA